MAQFQALHPRWGSDLSGRRGETVDRLHFIFIAETFQKGRNHSGNCKQDVYCMKPWRFYGSVSLPLCIPVTC